MNVIAAAATATSQTSGDSNRPQHTDEFVDSDDDDDDDDNTATGNSHCMKCVLITVNMSFISDMLVVCKYSNCICFEVIHFTERCFLLFIIYFILLLFISLSIIGGK